MSICPCCGSKTEKMIITPYFFGSHERAVVDALPFDGEGLTLDELITAVYGNKAYSKSGRNGTNDNRRGVIVVIINRLRKKLPSLGWTIPHSGGHRGSVARYKLEKHNAKT